jgi:glutamyl-Q tRNA(Asp) synthetase
VSNGPNSYNESYIGRFAPSPTGPLHLGSLYTALAGFLDARSHRGQWLLRIDDLDTPRNAPDSIGNILKTLEVFGLHWDGGIAFQSRHLDSYNEAIHTFTKTGLTYPCTCSRKALSFAPSSAIYPGICRNARTSDVVSHALRIKTDNRIIAFHDRLQGLIADNLAGQHGDFIVKRKDHVIAYQLAVVLDDDRQHITHVVRGIDLLESTPKQIYLQHILELPTPRYMHVPVIIDARGHKLSKQTQAPAVDLKTPPTVMFELLSLLKQNPPGELRHASCAEQLDWAVIHWDPTPLKHSPTVGLRLTGLQAETTGHGIIK